MHVRDLVHDLLLRRSGVALRRRDRPDLGGELVPRPGASAGIECVDRVCPPVIRRDMALPEGEDDVGRERGV